MVRFGPGCALYIALAALSCGRTPIDEAAVSPGPGSAPPAHPRQPCFAPGDESYAYFEGSAVRNGCSQDQGCIVTGCYESTCAAEPMQIPDTPFCEQRRYASGLTPLFGSCGCLAGECRWYFENDYDRRCDTDADCRGLGPPPEGVHSKSYWWCSDGSCRYP